MTLRVSMIVRNEAHRHLLKTMDCIMDLGAYAYVTDDASDDDTAGICQDYGATVRINERPKFWEHEGKARQEHLEWMDQFCQEGDWVLALDADETISTPEDLENVISSAEKMRDTAVTLPLYEFWTDVDYRIDGAWFGTQTPRLYKWQPGGQINDLPMGCGSEPTYVRSARFFRQNRCHLLHWGYVREEDRIRKHAAYTSRLGGHGHNTTHVESIIKEPDLRPYPF